MEDEGEVDLTFQPNFESTQVGSQQFNQDDNDENCTNGSYTDERNKIPILLLKRVKIPYELSSNMDDDEVIDVCDSRFDKLPRKTMKIIVKKCDDKEVDIIQDITKAAGFNVSQKFPKKVQFLGKQCLSQSHINQILEEKDDEYQVTESHHRVTRKKPKPKRKVTGENSNEYPYIAQAFKSMYKGQIDRNASCEKVEQFYEEAMNRLRLVNFSNSSHFLGSIRYFRKILSRYFGSVLLDSVNY